MDNDPLGVGKQMERERRARERSQQGRKGASGSVSTGGKKQAKNGASKNAALTMGQIFETCSITFDTFMQACYYSLNNGFTQVDAWRSFRSAVNTQSSSSTWDEGKQAYTVSSEELSAEEIASMRLSVKPFYVAMQHAATLFKANLEGQELLDPSSLPAVPHDDVEQFAATLSASLPEPILFESPAEMGGEGEVDAAEGKAAESSKAKKKSRPRKGIEGKNSETETKS